MQTQTLMFAVLVCLAAAVTAQHMDTEINSPDHQDHLRPRDITKHRRRRWQSQYPDLQTEILRVLDEISTYMRRAPPPPPPQPIYIPYPIYAAPNCRRKPTSSANPTINNRYPFMEDTRQNWGFETEDDDEDGDFSRPLEFRPPQAQTESPRIPGAGLSGGAGAGRSPASNSGLSVPSVCDGAVLSCCLPTYSKSVQKQCFANAGCGHQYSNQACSQNSINEVIQLYSEAYGINA